MYHATKPPIAFFWQPAPNGLRMQSKSLGLQFVREVSSAAEERPLAPEWSRIYIHLEYPKVKYHWNGKTVTVVCLSAYRHTQIPKASPAT
jgi:hypothetical protein